MNKNNFSFKYLVFPFSVILSFMDLPAQDRLPEILKQIRPSTVGILTFDNYGNAIGQGSGFFISSKGDIITNSHVIQNSNRVKIKTLEGNIYPLKEITAVDKQRDLILIRADISEPVMNYLSLSTSVPDVGERIIVVGSPFGLEATVSDGIVSAVRDLPGFGNTIQITAPISPGSSGSPVINMAGEVIGVATLSAIEGQNLNFAIPSTRVRSLIKEAASKWNDKGHNASTRNDFDTAIQHFSTAIELYPNYAVGFHNRGNSYYQLRKYQRAISDYSKAIELAPNVSYFFNSRGNVYFEIEQYEKAIADYKKGIDVQTGIIPPDDAQGVLFNGSLDPDPSVNYLSLGQLYRKTKNYEEAILVFDRGISNNPLNPMLYLVRAATFILVGMYKNAITDLDKGLQLKKYLDKRFELNEYMAISYSNRAYSYGALGKFEKAYEDINKALAFETKNPGTFYNIACFYAKQGKKHKALEYLEKAFNNGFRDYDWIHDDHDWDDIRNTNEFRVMLIIYKSKGR